MRWLKQKLRKTYAKWHLGSGGKAARGQEKLSSSVGAVPGVKGMWCVIRAPWNMLRANMWHKCIIFFILCNCPVNAVGCNAWSAFWKMSL